MLEIFIFVYDIKHGKRRKAMKAFLEIGFFSFVLL